MFRFARARQVSGAAPAFTKAGLHGAGPLGTRGFVSWGASESRRAVLRHHARSGRRRLVANTGMGADRRSGARVLRLAPESKVRAGALIVAECVALFRRRRENRALE